MLAKTLKYLQLQRKKNIKISSFIKKKNTLKFLNLSRNIKPFPCHKGSDILNITSHNKNTYIAKKKIIFGLKKCRPILNILLN